MRLDSDVLDVLDVLSTATAEGNALRLTRQLDRNMYVKVNKALTAAGGKWNRKAQAHLFDGDAGQIVTRMLDDQMVTSERTDHQFFPTPPAVVAELIEFAELDRSHVVLEPSAGEGAIAARIAPLVAAIDCVEMHEKHARALRAGAYTRNLTVADFLTIDPTPVYDRVVMNPPFARNAEIDHVEHALRFLKPGGLLVSVMSAGITFRNDRRTAAFRDLIEDADGGYEPLPQGSFSEAGTEVGTVIIAIPAPKTAAKTGSGAVQLDLFSDAVA